MKKLISLLLVLCLSIAAAAVFAEESTGNYVADHPEAAPYESVWVAEDGDWRIESFGEDDGVRLMIVHKLGDNKEDIWEYAAAMGQDGTLTTVPFRQHYQKDTATDEYTDYYEDGDAVFTINEEGKLIWKDLKEDAGKDLAFDKIGSFFGGRWMKGDIEVYFYEWYDAQYDIRLYKRGANNEILKDAILKGDYNAETNTVTAIGEFEGEEPFTVTFSYDEKGQILWNENGESTVMELSYQTD